MQSVQKYQRCCNEEYEFLITYSCGSQPDQTLLVCKSHYKEEAFHTCIIKIEKPEGLDSKLRPTSGKTQTLGSDTHG